MSVCVYGLVHLCTCVCGLSDRSHIYYINNRPPQVVFLRPASDPLMIWRLWQKEGEEMEKRVKERWDEKSEKGGEKKRKINLGMKYRIKMRANCSFWRRRGRHRREEMQMKGLIERQMVVSHHLILSLHIFLTSVFQSVFLQYHFEHTGKPWLCPDEKWLMHVV